MGKLWSRILKSIDESEDLYFTEGDIVLFGHEDELSHLKRAGFLVEASPAQKIYCPGCEQGCSREVIHKKSGIYLYCENGITTRTLIEPACLKRWKFDTFRMLSIINRFIKIEENPEIIIKKKIWRMGLLGINKKYVNLYFCNSISSAEKQSKNNNSVIIIPIIKQDDSKYANSKPLIALSRFTSISNSGWKFKKDAFDMEISSVLQKISIKESEPKIFPEYFQPNNDFSKIRFRDEWMELSPMQAKAIIFMTEKYKMGEIELLESDILYAAGSKSKRLIDIFKSSKKSKKNSLDYFEKLLEKVDEKPVRYRMIFE